MKRYAVFSNIGGDRISNDFVFILDTETGDTTYWTSPSKILFQTYHGDDYADLAKTPDKWMETVLKDVPEWRSTLVFEGYFDTLNLQSDFPEWFI